jgi:hypothetical protein
VEEDGERGGSGCLAGGGGGGGGGGGVEGGEGGDTVTVAAEVGSAVVMGDGRAGAGAEVAGWMGGLLLSC